MRISDLLAAKASHDVITITPESGVSELVAQLAEHNIGALIVSGDGVTLNGIVSERDVVRHLHQDGPVLGKTVAEIMSSPVETCTPSDNLDDVMREMTTGRFRHIPVISDGALVGIISIGDVVKYKIDQLQFERDQIESYVHQG